jgi:hypothetical protein
MLPSAAFVRWLWLQHGSSSSSSRHSTSTSTAAAAAAAQADPSSVDAYQSVVGLLQQTAEEGSKAAGIAAAKCVEEGFLPATLHFRAQ